MDQQFIVYNHSATNRSQHMAVAIAAFRLSVLPLPGIVMAVCLIASKVVGSIPFASLPMRITPLVGLSMLLMLSPLSNVANTSFHSKSSLRFPSITFTLKNEPIVL